MFIYIYTFVFLNLIVIPGFFCFLDHRVHHFFRGVLEGDVEPVFGEEEGHAAAHAAAADHGDLGGG